MAILLSVGKKRGLFFLLATLLSVVDKATLVKRRLNSKVSLLSATPGKVWLKVKCVAFYQRPHFFIV